MSSARVTGVRQSLVLSSLVIALLGCGSDSDASGKNGGDGGADTDNTGADAAADDATTGGGGTGGTGGGGTNTTGGGGSGASTTGGTDLGPMGAGIPASGEVGCLADQADLNVAFYFGLKKQCLLWDKKMGDFTAQEKMNLEYKCTSEMKGMLTSSCAAESRVAYCSGDLPGGMISETKVIYESVINPSAKTVARNVLAICGTSAGYDLSDRMLKAECKGTLSANVDGKEIDFSKKLTCLFKTDGNRTSMLVRGASDVNAADSKELTVYFLKSGTTVELKTELPTQPAYSYLEGATAAGGFTTPTSGSKYSVSLDNFAADGAALSGTFDLGTLGKTASSTGMDTRTISAGKINLTFDVL